MLQLFCFEIGLTQSYFMLLMEIIDYDSELFIEEEPDL